MDYYHYSSSSPMASAPGGSLTSESPVGALSLPPPTSFKQSPSVESFRCGSRSASASGSLALQSSEGVYGCPREEGCVEVVLHLLSRPLNQMAQRPTSCLIASCSAMTPSRGSRRALRARIGCLVVGFGCVRARGELMIPTGAATTADIINAVVVGLRLRYV
jgi:hypothetical protein